MVTDHQPLPVVSDPKRNSNAVVSASVHRWFGFLVNYSYTIAHKPDMAIGHADALFRLPLPEIAKKTEDFFFLFSTLHELTLLAKDIERETTCEKLLTIVRNIYGIADQKLLLRN